MHKILFSINIVETHCHGDELNKYTGMFCLAPNIPTHISYSLLAMHRLWQTDISFALYNRRIVFQFLAGAGGVFSPFCHYKFWFHSLVCSEYLERLPQGQRGGIVNQTAHLNLIPSSE